MEFVVDRVSEDSFYENILIGLPKILDHLPGVCDQYLERCPPVQHNIICAWEQKHGVLLPEDLRCFYASSNGLLYCYKVSFNEAEAAPTNSIEGKIEVNCMNDLNPVYGYEITNDPGVNLETERYELKLGADSKLFELINLGDVGKVCLVYINPRYLPTIWVHNASMQFFFLADDFTTYLKMCVHHLGIPFWQFAYTPDSVPEWSEMLFRLLAPSLLPLEKKLEDIRKNNVRKDDDEFPEVPINKVDPLIFKTTPKAASTANTVTKIPEVSTQSPRQNKSAKKAVKPKYLTRFQRKPRNK